MTRPAENQQTVEALNTAIAKTRERFAPKWCDDIEVRYPLTMLCDMRLADAVALAAALRVLVAQADEDNATIAYLVGRMVWATGETGVSSDAIVREACGGVSVGEGGPFGELPHDEGDLARCELAYERAPAHLQPKMLPLLENARAALARLDGAR